MDRLLRIAGVTMVLVGLGMAIWWGTLTVRVVEAEDPMPIVAGMTTNEPVRVGTTSEKFTKIRMMAVGDVMLGRTVNTRMLKYDNVDWPYEKTQQVLREADLAVGNLESPLIAACPATDSGMIFCGRAESAKGLKKADFDVLSVSNNHADNQGPEGKEETMGLLEQNQIVAAGEELVVTKEKGILFGWLGYNDVGGLLDPEQLRAEIHEARKTVDVLIVLMHWGEEYTDAPNDRQVMLGHMVVDAGADLVIGAHPHWVQPVERYKEGVIWYSLGNFIFDQMWSKETQYGEMADIELIVKDHTLESIDYEMRPIWIEDYGQPRLMTEE